jgi:Spy/CpxP family protein refolding chaperone
MNYRWFAVLMLGTFMTLPLVMARADEAGSPPANEGEAHHWKHGDGRMHDELGLTDDQKAKLKSIREAQEKALKPIWRKQRDLTIKLRDQLEDKAGEAEIGRTLTDLKANREAMTTEAKRFMSQREAILTPTQRARMMLKHGFDGERREHWGHKPLGDHDEDREGYEYHHDDHDDGGRDR